MSSRSSPGDGMSHAANFSWNALNCRLDNAGPYSRRPAAEKNRFSQQTRRRHAPGMDDEIEAGREGSAGQLVGARSDQARFHRHVQPFSYRVRPGAVYLEQVRFKAYRAEHGFDVIAR